MGLVFQKQLFFLKNFFEWLEGTTDFSLSTVKVQQSGKGHPKLLFSELSGGRNKHKTENLNFVANTEELIYAAQISQRKGGNINAASTIKKVSIQSLVTEKNIKISSKYLKSWEMDT